MSGLLFDQVAVGDELPVFRFELTATGVIAGALASRDFSPLHHDYAFVTRQAGHRQIFLNTPHQAAFFERYVGDWAGPRSRLGRMRCEMKSPVYAGDTLVIGGRVLEKRRDESGCGWLGLRLFLRAGEAVCTECEARCAMPVSVDDNPWLRRGQEWQP